MSVLTGLISGAAKGAAEAGKVVMDQELKKQLLEIQAQKQMMIDAARSELSKGEYTARLAADNANVLDSTRAKLNAADATREQRVASESADYTASKPLARLKAEDANLQKKRDAEFYKNNPVLAQAKQIDTDAGTATSTKTESNARAGLLNQQRLAAGIEVQTKTDLQGAKKEYVAAVESKDPIRTANAMLKLTALKEDGVSSTELLGAAKVLGAMAKDELDPTLATELRTKAAALTERATALSPTPGPGKGTSGASMDGLKDFVGGNSVTPTTAEPDPVKRPLAPSSFGQTDSWWR